MSYSSPSSSSMSYNVMSLTSFYRNSDGSYTTENPLIKVYRAKIPSTILFRHDLELRRDQEITEVYDRTNRLYQNLTANVRPISIARDHELPIQKFTCYGRYLIGLKQVEAGKILEIWDVDGTLIPTGIADFFKICNSEIITAAECRVPEINIWTSTGSDFHKYKTCRIPTGDLLKLLNGRKDIKFVPKDVFMVNGKVMMIYRLENKTLMKSEYLFWNALEGIAKIYRFDGDPFHTFFLSHNSLFIISKDGISCIDLSEEKEKIEITESYKINNILRTYSLIGLIPQRFEYFPTNEVIFLNYAGILLEINRKKGTVTIEEHAEQKITPLNRSFAEMDNGHLAVQKGNQFDVWDTMHNKKIFQNLRLMDESSHLRFECGTLYEINKNTFRIWEDENPNEHFEIFEMQHLLSFRGVTVHKFDFRLYIQTTFINESLNRLFIYDLETHCIINSFEGVLIPHIYYLENEVRQRKLGIDQLTIAKKDQVISPFNPDGAITLYNARMDCYQSYPLADGGDEWEPNQETQSNPRQRRNVIPAVLPISLVALSIIGIGVLTYKYGFSDKG